MRRGTCAFVDVTSVNLLIGNDLCLLENLPFSVDFIKLEARSFVRRIGIMALSLFSDVPFWLLQMYNCVRLTELFVFLFNLYEYKFKV